MGGRKGTGNKGGSGRGAGKGGGAKVHQDCLDSEANTKNNKSNLTNQIGTKM